MGLAINSNFSKVSYGASAAMKSQQGIMSKSLTRISTNKRFAGGGEAAAIKKSYLSKSDAAAYEALYYSAQKEVANANVGISAAESALDAISAYRSAKLSGDDTAATQYQNVLKGIEDSTYAGSKLSSLDDGTVKIGFKADGVAGGTLTVSVPSLSGIGSISGVSGPSGATSKISALATDLGTAYAQLEAADYASTFMQNMAGAADAAYSAITDTDIALEMTKYVKANINSQAAQAMVSQANQSMATILNLLQ